MDLFKLIRLYIVGLYYIQGFNFKSSGPPTLSLDFVASFIVPEGYVSCTRNGVI